MSPTALAQSALTGKSKNSVFSNEELPTIIYAEQISGRPERYIHFKDKVEVQKGDATFTAEKATYYNVEDELEASGNIRMTRPRGCYDGDAMRMQLDTGKGYVLNPIYTFIRDVGDPAHGHAKRIDFQSEERSTVSKGTYTTCQSISPDWYLSADTLQLDTGLDRGVAHGAVVYFKNVPIIATPSFLPLTFPLSSARKSGLLAPSYSSSTRGGLELTLPYYVNIAPNRDLTISPRLIARRGLNTALEARYLGETYAGGTTIEILPNDRQTNTQRYWLDTRHVQTLYPHLQLSWNVKAASDDNYAIDFFDTINKTAEHLLLRDLNVNYFGSFWNVGLRASGYQVLQDDIKKNPIVRPYDRLPQLSFHAEQQNIFVWSVDASLTRFWHPELVTGDRVVINPHVSLPLVQPAYFFVPTLQINAASYRLHRVKTGQPDSAQRVLPTFSIDSGLVFERDTNLFGEQLTQTLEPRLFYVNTPYRDQSKIPLFDTANADFNFAQMLNENRFSGQDRIGDANQLTTALTTRYVESNGSERAKFAVGQRFYFNTQKVVLDQLINPSRSDLLIAGSGRITPTLSVDAAIQISASDRRSLRSNYSANWQPAPRSVVSAGYRSQRDTLEQVDLSAQWPVAKRWYVMGRTNYSLRDKKVLNSVAGFEYKQDCWSLRFVAQRFAATPTSSPTHFFLQLELNGLSSLGSNRVAF